MTAFPDHASRSRRALTRTGLLVILSALLLAATPATTFAREGGTYVLQCDCTLEWSESWDGNGVLDEDASLDTVALVYEEAVLIVHQVPFSDGALPDFVVSRGFALEESVDGLRETLIDAGEDWILVGRTWTNTDGDTMVGVQYVEVWDVDFVMSFEFIAPDDTFVHDWGALVDVLLAGVPVLDRFDGEYFEDLA